MRAAPEAPRETLEAAIRSHRRPLPPPASAVAATPGRPRAAGGVGVPRLLSSRGGQSPGAMQQVGGAAALADARQGGAEEAEATHARWCSPEANSWWRCLRALVAAAAKSRWRLDLRAGPIWAQSLARSGPLGSVLPFRSPEVGRRCGDCWLGLNKGGGPMVPSPAKRKNLRMPFPIDLAGWSCSGRLRWRTPLGVLCLEFAGSDGIRSCAPMFYSDRLVSEGSFRSSAGC